MRQWRDAPAASTVLSVLNQGDGLSGIVALPPASSERTIKAIMTGDDFTLRAVKIGIQLSDDGHTWLTPDDDASLNLVIATSQITGLAQVKIAAHWEFARFTLADKIGVFKLQMEVQ